MGKPPESSLKYLLLADFFVPQPPEKEKTYQLHSCLLMANLSNLVGKMVIPAGFEVRSLNRRTGTLERCLCSFRANELRSLAFGTPHCGGASFVRPRPAAVCSNPHENNKNTETHEGLPYFW